MDSILRVEHMTLCFGGLMAVNDVSFDVKKRTIHSLIGPNGAGKTTIISMINGTLPIPRGKVYFDEADVTGAPTNRLARMGMGRTFQNIKLFDTLTVEENLLLGAGHIYEYDGFVKYLVTPRRQSALEKKAREAVAETLRTFGIYEMRNECVGSLAYGHKKIIELARTVMTNPKLILLDEPAAGLNPSERQEFIAVVQKIFDGGVDLFIIEHNMDVVMNLSDRITVINFGQKIAEGTPEEIRNNEMVISAYLGDRFKKRGGNEEC